MLRCDKGLVVEVESTWVSDHHCTKRKASTAAHLSDAGGRQLHGIVEYCRNTQHVKNLNS